MANIWKRKKKPEKGKKSSADLGRIPMGSARNSSDADPDDEDPFLANFSLSQLTDDDEEDDEAEERSQPGTVDVGEGDLSVAVAPSVAPRARSLADSQEVEYEIAAELRQNEWHAIDRPTGEINMAKCELYQRQLEQQFKQKLDDGLFGAVSAPFLLRQPVATDGNENVKLATTHFLRCYFQMDVAPSSLTLAGGFDAALDMCAYALFSPGDVVLCSSPFSTRVLQCFEERCQLELRPVPFKDLFHVRLHPDAFQAAYDKAIAKKKTVRGVFIQNPCRCTGADFTYAEVVALCNWANERNLWLIFDESAADEFKAVPSAEPSTDSFRISRYFAEASESTRQCCICIWTPSEDLCLPGLQFSAIHTENALVQKTLRRLSAVQSCAPLVQAYMMRIFEKFDEIDVILAEKRTRLLADREFVLSRLDQIGIPYVRPSSGCFVFIDLRSCIRSGDLHGERRLWRKLWHSGIYLNPCSLLGTAQAGWFQISVTLERLAMVKGLELLENIVARQKRVLQKRDRRKSAQNLEEPGTSPPSDMRTSHSAVTIPETQYDNAEVVNEKAATEAVISSATKACRLSNADASDVNRINSNTAVARPLSENNSNLFEAEIPKLESESGGSEREQEKVSETAQIQESDRESSYVNEGHLLKDDEIIDVTLYGSVRSDQEQPSTADRPINADANEEINKESTGDEERYCWDENHDNHQHNEPPEVDNNMEKNEGILMINDIDRRNYDNTDDDLNYVNPNEEQSQILQYPVELSSTNPFLNDELLQIVFRPFDAAQHRRNNVDNNGESGEETEDIKDEILRKVFAIFPPPEKWDELDDPFGELEENNYMAIRSGELSFQNYDNLTRLQRRLLLASRIRWANEQAAKRQNFNISRMSAISEQTDPSDVETSLNESGSFKFSKHSNSVMTYEDDESVGQSDEQPQSDFQILKEKDDESTTGDTSQYQLNEYIMHQKLAAFIIPELIIDECDSPNVEENTEEDDAIIRRDEELEFVQMEHLVKEIIEERKIKDEHEVKDEKSKSIEMDADTKNTNIQAQLSPDDDKPGHKFSINNEKDDEIILHSGKSSTDSCEVAPVIDFNVNDKTQKHNIYPNDTKFTFTSASNENDEKIVSDITAHSDEHKIPYCSDSKTSMPEEQKIEPTAKDNEFGEFNEKDDNTESRQRTGFFHDFEFIKRLVEEGTDSYDPHDNKSDDLLRQVFRPFETPNTVNAKKLEGKNEAVNIPLVVAHDVEKTAEDLKADTNRNDKTEQKYEANDKASSEYSQLANSDVHMKEKPSFNNSDVQYFIDLLKDSENVKNIKYSDTTSNETISNNNQDNRKLDDAVGRDDSAKCEGNQKIRDNHNVFAEPLMRSPTDSGIPMESNLSRSDAFSDRSTSSDAVFHDEEVTSNPASARRSHLICSGDESQGTFFQIFLEPPTSPAAIIDNDNSCPADQFGDYYVGDGPLDTSTLNRRREMGNSEDMTAPNSHQTDHFEDYTQPLQSDETYAKNTSPTSQLDDSGVFVENIRGSISIDFPLLVPISTEPVYDADKKNSSAALIQRLFLESDDEESHNAEINNESKAINSVHYEENPVECAYSIKSEQNSQLVITKSLTPDRPLLPLNFDNDDENYQKPFSTFTTQNEENIVTNVSESANEKCEDMDVVTKRKGTDVPKWEPLANIQDDNCDDNDFNDGCAEVPSTPLLLCNTNYSESEKQCAEIESASAENSSVKAAMEVVQLYNTSVRVQPSQFTTAGDVPESLHNLSEANENVDLLFNNKNLRRHSREHVMPLRSIENVILSVRSSVTPVQPLQIDRNSQHISDVGYDSDMYENMGIPLVLQKYSPTLIEDSVENFSDDIGPRYTCVIPLRNDRNSNMQAAKSTEDKIDRKFDCNEIERVAAISSTGPLMKVDNFHGETDIQSAMESQRHQIYHHLIMTRGPRTIASPRYHIENSDPAMRSKNAQQLIQWGDNEVVLEHTNITEIDYVANNSSHAIAHAKENGSNVYTSASAQINSFANTELFDEIRLSGDRLCQMPPRTAAVNSSAKHYYTIERVQSNGSNDLDDQQEASTSTPKADTVELNPNESNLANSRHLSKLRDFGVQTSKTGVESLCCRLRIHKAKRKLPSGTESANSKNNKNSNINANNNTESSIHKHEFVVCRNPRHAKGFDHCDPRRLYIIRQSTISSDGFPSKHERSIGDRYDVRSNSELIPSSRIDVVNETRTGQHSNSITVRHTPGSRWIVKSMCRSTPFGHQRTTLWNQCPQTDVSDFK